MNTQNKIDEMAIRLAFKIRELEHDDVDVYNSIILKSQLCKMAHIGLLAEEYFKYLNLETIYFYASNYFEDEQEEELLCIASDYSKKQLEIQKAIEAIKQAEG